jgi:hypothetical protein
LLFIKHLMNQIQYESKIYSVKNVIIKMLIFPQLEVEVSKTCSLLFLQLLVECCVVLPVFSSSATKVTLTLS